MKAEKERQRKDMLVWMRDPRWVKTRGVRYS